MCCQIMTCISTHSPPLVNATFEWENFRPGLLGLVLLGKHMGSTPKWSPPRIYHFGQKGLSAAAANFLGMLVSLFMETSATPLSTKFGAMNWMNGWVRF